MCTYRNPNTEKHLYLINSLDLNQKVGNYPELQSKKKEGICQASTWQKAHIIDLQGPTA